MRYSSVHQLIVAAFVLWFGSYAYVYIYEFTAFKPLYSYILLLGYFVFSTFVTRKLRALSENGMQSLILWLGLYLIYGCLAFFNSSQSDQAIQSVITLSEAVLLSGAFALLLSDPFLLRRAQAILAVLAVSATVVNGYDYLHPIFTSVPGRSAGLYENPNIAGHFIAMAMVAGINAVPQRWRLVFVLACGLGVLLTFSRASWIIWGLGVAWLGWLGVTMPERYRVVAFTLSVAISLGLMALLFAGALGTMLEHTGFSGYLDANTRARLGIAGSQLADQSAQTRILLIVESFRIGKETPIFGHGLGYTNEWPLPSRPHNMYLLFWVEGGLLGLLLYLGLMLLLFHNSVGVGRGVVVQLIVAGVFTHNQLEQPVFLMLMSFAVAHHAIMRHLRFSARAMVPHAGRIVRT